MAHNLAFAQNGEARFAHANVDPWHSLGQNLGQCVSSEEMIKAAHLNFSVTKEQLFTADGRKAPAYATMASDTLALLGIVGEKYTPLQNSEAFAFTDSLVAAGEMKYVTAGALGVGERVWILAQTPDHMVEIVKGDPIETYLLFSNSHDGSSSVDMRSTSVTVVCQNTLNMAMKASEASMKLRHTVSVRERLGIASGILQAHVEHQRSWVEAMQYLAKFPITDDLIQLFENSMFGDPNSTPEGRASTILTSKLDQFEHLLFKGKGTEIPGRVGNLYGVVQAYTEWTDWFSRVDGDRTNSIVFNNGAKQKTKALELALTLAR